MATNKTLTHGATTLTTSATWEGTDTLAAKSQTYTFATGGKYVDQDIVLKVTAQDGTAGAISGGGLTHGNTTLSDGSSYISTTNSGYGPIKFQNTASRAAANYGITEGWISSAGTGLTATGDDTKTSSSYYVKAASSPSLAITDKPSTAISVGTLSSGYYPLTASLEGKMTVGTAGWVPTTGLTATDSSVTVGRVAAATFKNTNIVSGTTTDGRSYTDISSTAPVLVSEGYLYITAGYTPDVKISLAKLSPNEASSVADIQNGMLNSVSAYDNDGKLVTGNIATVTPTTGVTVPLGTTATTINRGTSIKIPQGYIAGDLYFTAQGDAHSAYTPSTTYFTGTTGTAAGTGISAAVIEANKYSSAAKYVIRGGGAANSASATITGGSSNEATPTTLSLLTTAPSGNYYTLTANGSGGSKVSTAGWFDKDATLPAASTTKDYYVKKGVVTNNTSGGTSSGTINRGNQIKISAGYYPSDLYYTAQADAHSAYTPSTTYFTTTNTGYGTVEKDKYAGSNYYIKAASRTGNSYTLLADSTKASGYSIVRFNLTTAGWLPAGNVSDAEGIEVFQGAYTVA